jgi:hypothetical protein
VAGGNLPLPFMPNVWASLFPDLVLPGQHRPDWTRCPNYFLTRASQVRWMVQDRRRTAAATRELLARRRRPTAFARAAKVIQSAFAIPQTHGRSSRTPARSKISAIFWESLGDAGQGRISIVPSASR